jgi:5-methylthioadenosine/S-adenosylhomocysteine deaminase
VTALRDPVTIVRADVVHSVDAEIGTLLDAGVAFAGDTVLAVASHAALVARYPGAHVIDHRPCMIVPGLVDAHHHPGIYFFSQLRPRTHPPRAGLLARGGDVERFLALFAHGAALDPDETFAAAQASLARGLLGGCTYFNDGAGGDVSGLVEAARALGVRGVLTYDFGSDLAFAFEPADARPPALVRVADPDELLRRAERAVAAIRCVPGLTAWYNVVCDLTASDALYLATTRAARAAGVGINTHTSTVANHETVSRRLFGKSSTRRLLDLGVIGPHWVGAHMGFLEADEMRDLAAASGHVAHCPGTSMGAGKGIVTSRAMLKLAAAGVNIALGTDSAQWADMPGQMSLAFHGHKDAAADDTVFTPEEVLRMATLHGAMACGKAAEIGSLAPGKRADIVVVGTDSVRFAALPDPLYAWLRVGHSGDIAAVFLGGELRVRGGEVLGADLARIADEAKRAARRFLARAS